LEDRLYQLVAWEPSAVTLAMPLPTLQLPACWVQLSSVPEKFSLMPCMLLMAAGMSRGSRLVPDRP